MSEIFDKAFSEAINYEGGYVNHPSDPGGATKYGITQRVAREYGYYGDMRYLPLETAKEIYRERYWEDPKFNLIKNEDIAVELFEQGINMGVVIAILHLQRSYNLLVDNQIKVDGVIGSQTAGAINSYRHPEDIFLWMNVYQGNRYISLVKKNDRLKDFIRGWGRRVKLKRQ